MTVIADHLQEIVDRLVDPECTEDQRLAQAARLQGIVDAMRTGKGPQRSSPKTAPVVGHSYTITQAAEKLGLTYGQVKGMVDTGRMPSFDMPHSGRKRIPIAAVERILRDRS